MVNEICVIGQPGGVGGAGSELDHQITCWQSMGVVVHVLPTQPLLDGGKALKARCCIVHEPQSWANAKDHHVISFCNQRFLSFLPQIRRHARTVSWVNCMTWNFKDEVRAQFNGLIDFHLYQTKHAQTMVSKGFVGCTWPYRPLMFTPFFDAEQFPFIAERDPSVFCVGRISRNALDKYAANQLRIWTKFNSPLPKRGLIVGWSKAVQAKCGKPPEWVQAVPPRGRSQEAFYKTVDAIVMSTDTLENLPRVGMEAMASGSVLVVDKRGGWQLQVKDGVTGWLCENEGEFAYKTTRLAHEPSERKLMAAHARQMLESKWGLEVATQSWARVFEAWTSR